MTQRDEYSLTFPMGFGIGFEDMMEGLTRRFENIQSNTGNYPPYNIIQESDTESIVELAVAGFTEEDLNIEVDGAQLTITGNKDVKLDDAKYRHKGIAYRNFKRTFALADHIEVNGASVADGILRIYLEMELPEELQPKRIPIVTDRQLLNEQEGESD